MKFKSDMSLQEKTFYIPSSIIAECVMLTKRQSGAMHSLLVAGTLFAVTVSALATRSMISLPTLSGPLSVGTISFEVIDSSRLDPYAPAPQSRALMISLFYPTTDTKHLISPYLPTNLASFADQSFGFPPSFLEQIKTRCYLSARLSEIPSIPIILFSPGLGGARESYTIMLSALASYGYLVISIDHTYDAAAVEFPDGSLVLGLPINGDALAIDTRVKDSRFIIDQLSNSTFVSQIPGILHRNLNSSKIAMFGHSLGGSTTLQAMEADSRILGGVTLDGPFSGSQLTTSTKKPFLLFGRENHTRYNDPEWTEVWKHLKGWKAELTLANSTHLTFSDENAVFELLGVGELVDPGGVTYGGIDGLRANAVLVEYLKGFFDMMLNEGSGRMFEKADTKFPEVTII